LLEEIDSQYIREPLSRDLARQGRLDPSTRDDVDLCETDLRRWYGCSFEEFVDVRNSLLIKRNGKLHQEELHDFFLKKIVLDLVLRGYLYALPNGHFGEVHYTLTNKAVWAVVEALDKQVPKLPDDPYEALVFLRNMNLLDDKHNSMQWKCTNPN